MVCAMVRDREEQASPPPNTLQNVLFTESFGGKMINAMKNKGITFYELKGKADDAVKEVLKLK